MRGNYFQFADRCSALSPAVETVTKEHAVKCEARIKDRQLKLPKKGTNERKEQ